MVIEAQQKEERELNEVKEREVSLEQRETVFEQETINAVKSMNNLFDEVVQELQTKVVTMENALQSVNSGDKPLMTIREDPILRNIKKYLSEIHLSDSINVYYSKLTTSNLVSDMPSINACVTKLTGIKINPVEKEFELATKYAKIQTILMANGIQLESWIPLIQTHCLSTSLMNSTRNINVYDDFLAVVFAAFPFIQYEQVKRNEFDLPLMKI